MKTHCFYFTDLCCKPPHLRFVLGFSEQESVGHVHVDSSRARQMSPEEVINGVVSDRMDR